MRRSGRNRTDDTGVDQDAAYICADRKHGDHELDPGRSGGCAYRGLRAGLHGLADGAFVEIENLKRMAGLDEVARHVRAHIA